MTEQEEHNQEPEHEPVERTSAAGDMLAALKARQAAHPLLTANQVMEAMSLEARRAALALRAERAEIEALEEEAEMAHAPPKNAPIHRWLIWRERQKEEGKRITLEELAERSGYSISYVKKQNAKRTKEHKKNTPVQ